VIFLSDKKILPVFPHLEDENLFDTFKAASATDCTGLMQRTNLNDDEIESYKDIYDFGPNTKEDIE